MPGMNPQLQLELKRRQIQTPIIAALLLVAAVLNRLSLGPQFLSV
jgi:hypothetical protein